MSEYNFTTDWFKSGPPIWEQLVAHLPARKKFLEIGSFEGRSTVWTIENMMEDGGEIFCLDTWGGGEEHGPEIIEGCEDRFYENIGLAREKFPQRGVMSFKARSNETLAALQASGHANSFDFVYIDGSHIAKDVMTDACMSWPLLKVGAFMVFDDYMWKPPEFGAINRPKIAVDTFTTLFEEDLMYVHLGYQFIIRKMR